METDDARRRVAQERERAEADLARLEGEVKGQESRGELTSVDQHQADEGTDLYEREVAEGRLIEVKKRLKAIARAEARLAAGTYGRSILSGEPISDERLARLPLAELTVDEEREMERAPAEPGDGDEGTPLDEHAAAPPDLAAIPMRRGSPEPDVDPQEDADEVIAADGGSAYPGEGGAPLVGEPEGTDPAIDRTYRPER